MCACMFVEVWITISVEEKRNKDDKKVLYKLMSLNQVRKILADD